MSKVKEIGINGIDRPEDCQTMMRDPAVEAAREYLFDRMDELSRFQPELEVNLRILLDDHTALEQEIQRMARLLQQRSVRFSQKVRA